MNSNSRKALLLDIIKPKETDISTIETETIPITETKSSNNNDSLKNLYSSLGISFDNRVQRIQTKSNEQQQQQPQTSNYDVTFMDPEEFKVINEIIIPSVIDSSKKSKYSSKDTKKTKQQEQRLVEIDDDDQDDLLFKMITETSIKFDKKKLQKHINKITKDLKIEKKKLLIKKRSYDTYTDFRYFDSLKIFDIEWRSMILSDQNVEIPFIYLQSLQTAGIGAIPYDLFSCIETLEAYGMTVEIISELPYCCNYRAFFSGRMKKQGKADDISSIREKAIEIEKTSKNKKQIEGGASSSTYDEKVNTYEDLLYQNSEKMGVDRLRIAQKLASEHEKPIEIFKPNNFVSEMDKKEKKKENIMKMSLNLNSIYQNETEFSDEDSNNQEEKEEETVGLESEYDYLMNGFTKNLINQIKESTKFMNKKSLDSVARNQTELSSFIENHLCVDICIFPGKIEKNQKSETKIERQLIFMFSLQSQNPYTFYLLNREEKDK